MSINGATPVRRYPVLDALRGSAAFAVVFYHVLPPEIGVFLGFRPFASGYLAVDLFFVLSGYVVSHAYETRLRSTLTFSRFMVIRFIRLQPVMAVGTLIGCALAIWQRTMNLEDAPGFFEIATAIPVNFLMLPNIFVPWGIFLFNPPTWSLFYEFLANFVYATFVRLGATQRIIIAHMTLVLCVIFILGFASILISVIRFGDIDRGVILSDWQCALARIGFSFPVGILLQRTQRYWRKCVPDAPMILIVILCLGFLVTDVFEHGRMVYDLVFVGIVSPLLVMLAAVSAPRQRLIPMAEWLGAISYPLYAVHAPIKHVAVALFALQGATFTFSVIAVSIGFAWLTARIDPILQRWLHQKLKEVSARFGKRIASSSAIASNI